MPRVALPRYEKTEVWLEVALVVEPTTVEAQLKVAQVVVVASTVAARPAGGVDQMVASTAVGRLVKAAMAGARVGMTAAAIEVGWQEASGVAAAREAAQPVAEVVVCEVEEQRVAAWGAVVVERDAGNQGLNRGD